MSAACCRKNLGARNWGIPPTTLPVCSISATRPSSCVTTRSTSPSASQSIATGRIISRSIVIGLSPSVMNRPFAYRGFARVPTFSK